MRGKRRTATHRTAPNARVPAWTVRRYLAAIVVAVVGAFAGVGAYVGYVTWRNAEAAAAVDAESVAALAAADVADTVATSEAQVTAVAANPTLPGVLASPAGCHLNFSLSLFPAAHLDLVRPDGQVVCTSAGSSEAASPRDAPPWLDELRTATNPIQTRPFVDGTTGQPTIVIGAAVHDAQARLVGLVALVTPMGGSADRLATSYGGSRKYQFAVVDTRTGIVLSASRVNPMKDRGLLVRSRPIRGTSWRSYAGVERASTLSPTRSSLTRGAVLGGLALLALLAAFAVVSRRIGRPLRQLTDAVGATGPHADEALLAIRGPREIRTLADEFRTVLAAHTGYEEQLVHQALHDPLTGLANRALLGERLALSLEQANRNGRSVAVLLLGLDRFKFVNDSLGHAAGDEVLIQLAARLRAFVRAGDTLARFGGDEFVMVAEGVETPEDAARIGASLLAEVETPIQAADTVVRLSASVGMTLSTPRSRADELIRDADNARHHAKDLGSARCELFDDELRHRATTRLRLESELRVALERGELRLVYQPKVELLGGEIRGVEALLRWDHPGLGLVPPSTFIPIAEETGMIVEIGRFVLEEASRLAAGWQRDGRDLTMAVNVSGRQLADGDFGADVAAVLATTGLHPGRLFLELTETLLMTEAVRTTPTLRGLHDRGVRISIDDFGTGYSSLAYLHRFPVDELKIDRVFVHDLIDHAGQRALVGGMIAMGKALDLEIVAEGVETEAQAHELRLLGCDAAQGYLFAAPQTPEGLQRLLAEQPRRARTRPLS